MTLNADTGCGGGGTVSFVGRREKGERALGRRSWSAARLAQV